MKEFYIADSGSGRRGAGFELGAGVGLARSSRSSRIQRPPTSLESLAQGINSMFNCRRQWAPSARIAADVPHWKERPREGVGIV